MLDIDKLPFFIKELNLKMTSSFSLNDIIVVKTCLKYAKKSYIRLSQEMFDINVYELNISPKVKAEIQVVLINKKKTKKYYASFRSFFLQK